MARPINLVDKIHDFGVNGDIPLLIQIESSAFSSKYTKVRQGAIAHKVSTGIPTVPKLQNANGQDVPPASSEIITEALPGNNNFTQTNVTVKGLTSSNQPTFNCRIDSPNRWQSDFFLYYNPNFFGEYYISENNFTSDPSLNTHEYYIFKVFQKSVAIIEDISSSPVIVNGQTKSLSINSLVRISKSKSRGKEIASSFSVQVKDSNGNFINAIQGTDYSITFGSLNADVLEIQLNQPKLFRILNKVIGFTSNNNTYPGTGYGSVNLNEDSSFYLLDVQGSVVNNQDIITLPKITPNVIIQNQVTSNPIQTGYSGANVSVQSNIDSASGIYSTKDLNTGSVTIVPMTEAQWIQELNARTNITLEIKRKNNNEVVITRSGLGPHTNINLPVGDFLVQFKTILK